MHFFTKKINPFNQLFRQSFSRLYLYTLLLLATGIANVNANPNTNMPSTKILNTSNKFYFDDLLIQAWQQQPTLQSKLARQNALDTANNSNQKIFKERPQLEINTGVGKEKELEIKTSFEFNPASQRQLYQEITQLKHQAIELEQHKEKLTLAKNLQSACWQFISTQKQLKNSLAQINLAEALKNNSAKQYQAGMISQVDFKQVELDLLKLQNEALNARREFEKSQAALKTITRIEFAVDDQLIMNTIATNEGFVEQQAFKAEKHIAYHYQQNYIQQILQEQTQLAHQTPNPITWSVGASVKRAETKNYQLMLGAQIPLGKNYENEARQAELTKDLAVKQSELKLLKSQLENDFQKNLRLVTLLSAQLKINQQAIAEQTQIMNVYAKGLKVGEVDIATYLKSKQMLFDLQQQDSILSTQLDELKALIALDMQAQDLPISKK